MQKLFSSNVPNVLKNPEVLEKKISFKTSKKSWRKSKLKSPLPEIFEKILFNRPLKVLEEIFFKKFELQGTEVLGKMF